MASKKAIRTSTKRAVAIAKRFLADGAPPPQWDVPHQSEVDEEGNTHFYMWGRARHRHVRLSAIEKPMNFIGGDVPVAAMVTLKCTEHSFVHHFDGGSKIYIHWPGFETPLVGVAPIRASLNDENPFLTKAMVKNV